jgi:hypothetical protein
MGVRHRDGPRVDRGRHQDDHHADGRRRADRHVRRRDPHAFRRRHDYPGEAVDLRAAVALDLAAADPADGPLA